MSTKKPSPSAEAKPARGTSSKNKRPEICPIVGIGASAGGLETYTELLKALPVDTGMAFVLVQHLDPKHPSILADLLAKTTNMPVTEVKDGTQTRPNNVYVIPQNADMAVLHGVLHLLTRPQDARKPPMPIDFFFRSLAQDQGGNAIGVVLSGTASDGAQGLKMIQTEGGITFAQDPASAKYDGMPRAAIAAGGADFIMSPGVMAAELARLGRHPYVARLTEAESEPVAEGDLLGKIYIFLRGATGVDFTHYKQSTIKRRIARRLALYKLETLEDYVKYMQKYPVEVTALFDDILITVTRFFREQESFEALKTEVFPRIIKGKGPENPIRLWIAGCATGEEAYSVAMSLLEFLEDRPVSPPVQVFATDIHEKSIEQARRGIYPESIAEDVSPSRLRRFFVPVEGGYQVNRLVRDMCVFARHNTTKDPPFSRLDFISCRNVLIYLGPALQQKVIPMFHWALNPTGFLMVGSSETVGHFTSLFELIDRKNKVYGRKAAPARLPVDFSTGGDQPVASGHAPDLRPVPPWPDAPREFDLGREADRAVLDRHTPAGVVIDENLEIIQFRGHTGPYLEPSPGKASLNLIDMARAGIKLELRAAVFQAKKTKTPVTKEHVLLKYNGAYRDVNLEVSSLKAPSGVNYYLILFIEAGPATPLPRRAAGKPKRQSELEEEREATRLTEELVETKKYLQTIIEERDVTNEELRAANEELQSSTEELQSINEELETAKEELQSTNEELTTVNEELQIRNVELTQTNDDLTNLLTSATIPIVMLSNDLRVRRATPLAEKALNVRPTDFGRPLTDIKLKIDFPDLEQLVGNVIETVTTTELETQDADGRWYSIQIRPYVTLEKKIEGAVISFIDIDSLKRSELEMKAARDFSEAVVETVSQPLIVLDQGLHIISANAAFYQTFRVFPAQTEGKLIFDLGNQQWDIPELRQLLENILPKRTLIEAFEVEHKFPDLGQRTMLLSARRLAQTDRKNEMILLAIEDITKRNLADQALKQEKDKAEKYIDIVGAILVAIDANQNVILINKKGCEILGYRKNEIIGKNWFDNFLPALVRDKVKVVAAQLLAGDVEPVEYFENQILTRGGDERLIAWHNTILKDETGKIFAHLSSGEDITERKRIEEERVSAQGLGAALNEINALIHSTLDFDLIIQQVIMEAVEAVGCDSAAVVLASDNQWTVSLVHGLPPAVIGVVSAEQTVHLELIAKTQQMLVVTDTHKDRRVNRPLMEKTGIRSFIAVPLIVRQEVIGVLALHYRSAPTPFTEAQIDFTGKAAASISLAMENARLYAQQHYVADTLQEALLVMPIEVPGIVFGHLYEGAVETARVGGDFYDVFDLGQDIVGITVGDVSGKGLGAATVTSLIKDTIRAYAYEGDSPAKVMEKTNALLIRTQDASMFTTVFFGVLQTESGALTYCSAGHPPGIIKQRGPKIRMLECGSPALGVMQDVEFVDCSTRLHKTETLILYTDGVIEARQTIELYGEERLCDFIKGRKFNNPKEIPVLIFKEIIAFAEGNLADDVAILAVGLK